MQKIDITLTLENNANVSLLQRTIESLKGVIQATIMPTHKSSKQEKGDYWLRTLRELRDEIDGSVIDLSDERTQYILSK